MTSPRFIFACSTPEGVIVSIASSGSNLVMLAFDCSTPEGVIVSIARQSLLRQPAYLLLNARRRHRLDRPNFVSEQLATKRLLNARRRHRLDHSASPDLRWTTSILLNARRRHRLDHIPFGRDCMSMIRCSTPEGVIVSIA